MARGWRYHIKHLPELGMSVPHTRRLRPGTVKFWLSLGYTAGPIKNNVEPTRWLRRVKVLAVRADDLVCRVREGETQTCHLFSD